MKANDNVQLMDELMNGITQSDMWLTEQMQNPEIRKASNGLNASLKKIRGKVPDEAYHEICDATLTYAVSFETAAILYGIHVADAMCDVAARPSDLSRHILARTGGGLSMSDKIMVGGNLEEIYDRLQASHATFCIIQANTPNGVYSRALCGACDLLECILRDFHADIEGAEDYEEVAK